MTLDIIASLDKFLTQEAPSTLSSLTMLIKQTTMSLLVLEKSISSLSKLPQEQLHRFVWQHKLRLIIILENANALKANIGLEPLVLIVTLFAHLALELELQTVINAELELLSLIINAKLALLAVPSAMPLLVWLAHLILTAMLA